VINAVKSNIIDVAKLAGVSISTVSRVLNNNYPVSEDARKRVLDATAALKYTPNFIASIMKSRQVNMLGVVLPNLNNNVIMSIANTLMTEAKKSGYTTLFACSENNGEKEKTILNMFRSSLVDAVVVASVLKDDLIFRELQASNIPVALFDRMIANSDTDWVGEDGYRASYEMTKYIIGKGHQRIAFLKGVSDVTISIERYNGYLDAMNEAGIKIAPELQLQGSFQEDRAHGIVLRMFKNMERKNYPTAIFSSNSSMIKGAMNAIHECGLRIPEDISVASYGDLDLPKSVRPSITCIHQNTLEIGKTLNNLIMRRLDEKYANKTRLNPMRIIVPIQIYKGDSVVDIS
jgi:DNA-binding LacI/PurR family transcriptional regulator